MTWIPIEQYNWTTKKREVIKEQCSDCDFQKEIMDPIGTHMCPTIIDGRKNIVTVGDHIFAFSDASGIVEGTLEKYNRKTGYFTIRLCDKDSESLNRERLAISHRRKVLKADY